MTLPAYHPPKWLVGAHMQTIWAAKVIKTPAPVYNREYLTTPDGQTKLACDFVFAEKRESAPLVVMFHGLEGSSQSHYAKALMIKVKEIGINGTIIHFRGCGGVPITGKKAYHAGDSEEIAWILSTLTQRFAHIYVTGVSLGGNMLAKYLGEAQEQANCEAAAVISAPLDMLAASKPLSKGFGKAVYTRDFLRTLIPKAHELWQKNPGAFDWPTVKKAKTFAEFDSAFTAPLHGYKDALDYWVRTSAKPLLKDIRVPTLVLNARNDPFIPWHSLPQETEVSAAVSLLQPEHGGHVGFVSGTFPGHVNWLPQTILQFFELLDNDK